MVFTSKYPIGLVQRIDFICCTDEIRDGMGCVEILRDTFTDRTSDHRPIVVEFRAPKKTK